MAKFNGFLDNLASGALSPKGNLADWQHASRLFVDDGMRLAPKTKFLFHVHFTLNPIIRKFMPDLVDQHGLEIGMLVRAADLPKYSASVDTKNKYNRKKNITVRVDYDPVNITFHDDNYGVTTALLEAYYRYNFADGNYGTDLGAYSRERNGAAGFGDNTYLGGVDNKYRYGLDNNVGQPMFTKIEISQLARKTYQTYTLVNPTVTNWAHDSVDNSDTSSTMTNTLSVAYESVYYSRGPISSGENGNPTGFGAQHYDTTPSSTSLTGGRRLGIGDSVNAAIDLYTYISTGKGFRNPLEAALAAANLFGSIRGLSKAGVREELFGFGLKTIGNIAGINVGGVSNTDFPKLGGLGGTASKVAAVATAASFVGSVVGNSPSANRARAKAAHIASSQANGIAGGINNIMSSFKF